MHLWSLDKLHAKVCARSSENFVNRDSAETIATGEGHFWNVHLRWAQRPQNFLYLSVDANASRHI